MIRNCLDRTFDLVLYTSDGDQPRRYFDQEEGKELCRCCIDLGTYPSFQEQAEASPFGNFYVGGCEYRSRVGRND